MNEKSTIASALNSSIQKKTLNKFLHFSQIFLTAVTFLLVQSSIVFSQTYSSSLISSKSIIQTDRRPIPVGYYDSTANKTFVSWIGFDAKPVVKEFDHTTKIWSENKFVGSSFRDKHNYPGMLKGPDGRIYIFHGCHNSTLKMSVSPNPGTIEGTWTDRFINEAQKASYPAPILTEEGTFYVFYRDTRNKDGKSQDRPYQFVKSTDNGATWARQMAIDPYPRANDGFTEVYNGKVSYQPTRGGQKAKIHIAWTISGPKLPTESAHATYGRNVYYTYLDPSNDHFYNVEGVDLGTHIDNLESDAHCLVWDSGIPQTGDPTHLAALQVSATYMDNGLPLVYYSDTKATNNRETVATWNIEEKKWIFVRTGSNIGEPRDIEKFGPQSFRTYCPSGTTINVYKTLDGGLTWSFETSFSTAESMSRVYVINDFHPEVKILMTQRPGSVNTADGSVYTAAVTSNFSPQYVAGDGVTVPTKPDSFRTTYIGHNRVSLEWKDSNNETTYQLEYIAGNDTAWKTLQTIGRDVTSYTVTNLLPLTSYRFRLRAENSYVYSDYTEQLNISTPLTHVEKDDSSIPEGFYLYEAYPNPFNPTTRLSYTLPYSTHVKLAVYDLMGREVEMLVNDFQEAGNYSFTWNATAVTGKQLSSGIYLARIQAGSFSKTVKLLLMK